MVDQRPRKESHLEVSIRFLTDGLLTTKILDVRCSDVLISKFLGVSINHPDTPLTSLKRNSGKL